MRLTTFCIALLAVSICYAGPVGVDGSLGAEWSGITPVHVGYSSSAPNGNFGSPTPTADMAYDIYLRADATYLYGFLQTRPDIGGTPIGNFANLYFDTNPAAADGSDLGFEIGLSSVNGFIPGGAGGYIVMPYFTIADSSSGPMAKEFAFELLFLNDPLGMGFPVDTEGKLVLRLSQSFGYSVAGGATYGTDRLGAVTFGDNAAPEPSTTLLVFAGLTAAALLRRRARI